MNYTQNLELNMAGPTLSWSVTKTKMRAGVSRQPMWARLLSSGSEQHAAVSTGPVAVEIVTYGPEREIEIPIRIGHVCPGAYQRSERYVYVYRRLAECNAAEPAYPGL